MVFKCFYVLHIDNNSYMYMCSAHKLSYSLPNSQSTCGFPVSSRNSDTPLIDLLKKMNRNMELITKKLDRLIELQRPGGQFGRPGVSLPEDMPLDVTTLLSLPDHLRKSALALSTLREATATDLSKETNRW